MKRITFWLLTVSFTFILGLAVTLIYLKFFYPVIQTSESLPEISLPEIENNPADLPVLTFCELVNNPEKYDGKTVRLSAKLSVGLEGSWFSDSNCGVDNTAIISVKNNEVWKTIDKARERKNKEPWDTQINLTVVGKFKNTVYKDWCCLTAPFQFEISNGKRRTSHRFVKSRLRRLSTSRRARRQEIIYSFRYIIKAFVKPFS